MDHFLLRFQNVVANLIASTRHLIMPFLKIFADLILESAPFSGIDAASLLHWWLLRWCPANAGFINNWQLFCGLIWMGGETDSTPP